MLPKPRSTRPVLGARRTLSLVLTAATVAVLAACGSSGGASSGEASESSSTTGSTPGASAEGFPVTVDTMFGEVTVPEEPERVVALGWSDAEMALALGVEPVAVKDWQGFGGTGVGPWASDLFTTPPEVVLPSGETSVEEVAALDPDLILNVRSDGDEAMYDQLSQIAPTVYAPEGTPSFGAPWRVQMTQIAQALGMPEKGEEVISDVEDQFAAAREAHPELEGTEAVVAAAFDGQYGAYLPGDGRFDVMTELGMVGKPAIQELPSQGFYAPVSAENVDLLDSDVLVAFPIGGTVEELESDPLLQNLPVAKDGRLITLDPEGELAGAFSAASTLALSYTIDELVPQLADAAQKATG